MSRDATPLFIEDLSLFTKSLRKSLSQSDVLPGHLAMLGMISRAAGQRNYQTLRTSIKPTPSDGKKGRLKTVLRLFDAENRMIRWPKKTSLQGLSMWVFWADVPPRQSLSEHEVNTLIRARMGFDDHALIRRSLIDHRLMIRKRDGSAYQRIEQKPPEIALALIKTLKGRAVS